MLESDNTSIRHSTKQGRKSSREEELSRIVRNCEDIAMTNTPSSTMIS